jgi:3-hydroxyacyl-CoA dehydrogenase/enoyl-CoA hydratase/3-hydroxybutyryl-CoA epimerase
MTIPALTQFRIEPRDNGLIHLVFDCPDRSMNVFSNKAIHELGSIAEWLRTSDARGVVIRSGKASGFCAGADLAELGVAYDTIVAAPAADRFDIAYNHFFPLSHAIRRLETAGIPIAAAIAGVALGGGCELTMGAHYRVATTSKRAKFGLPECAVGLLPGAGGTQRMPRFVGIELGLEVLLQGKTLQGQAAVESGLVNELVDEGDEVAAAERWLLSPAATARQPWDDGKSAPLPHPVYAPTVARHRKRELARMLGHEPAPLAILDCVELGLMQTLDGAIRSEMSVFARLIQRREARNMIRTMFLGKQAYDKAARDDAIPSLVVAAAQQAATLVADAACTALITAGFACDGPAPSPVQSAVADGYWFEGNAEAAAIIRSLASRMAALVEPLSADELLQADHLVVRNGTIPAYLGGLSGLAAIA